MNWVSCASASIEKETPGERKGMVKKQERSKEDWGPNRWWGGHVQPASPGAEIGRKREQSSHLHVGLGGQKQKSTD